MSLTPVAPPLFNSHPHPNPPHPGEGTDRAYRSPVRGDPAPPPPWGRLGGGNLFDYGPDVEAEIHELTAHMAELPGVLARFNQRWLAVQLLEGETNLLADLPDAEQAAVNAAVAESRLRLEPSFGADLDIAIAGTRYQFVHDLTAQVMSQDPNAPRPLTDRIDAVVTHRWLGIPIFLGLMYLVFNMVQNVSAPYVGWVDGVFSGPLTRWAVGLLGVVSAPAWLISLVTDGVIAGVGGVLAFLPGLLVMYFALAFLEDSGYLVRAAFVMDRAMRSLGLHGKSFVPMILGFGCNVPAIYATRTIESRSARILTGLLVPFMSCSARLPIFVVFGLAFFPQRGDVVILAMYLLGMVIAALVGVILSRTVFRDADQGTFVMEMPTYRLPTLRALLSQMWEHSAGFVRKAGTFILSVSVVLWVLMHLPWGVTDPQQSYFGQVSTAAAPIFAPAGFGTWQSTGALVSGLVAKEVVVSTLAQIYVGEAVRPVTDLPTQTDLATIGTDLREIAVSFGQATVEAGKRIVDVLTPGLNLFPQPTDGGDTGLSHALQGSFTPLSALAFLVFALLYSPCVATIGAQAQEYGWRWAILSTGMTLGIAWGMAVLVFQLGTLLGVA